MVKYLEDMVKAKEQGLLQPALTEEIRTTQLLDHGMRMGLLWVKELPLLVLEGLEQEIEELNEEVETAAAEAAQSREGESRYDN